MKTYKKNKFKYNDRNPQEGDVYINTEYGFSKNFPFLRKRYVVYRFLNNKWIPECWEWTTYDEIIN